MAYATVEQYRDFTKDQTTVDDYVTAALEEASELIDELAAGALYDTGEDGLPTDADVIDLFMRAACAQAQYLIVLDDPTGAKATYTSVSVGSVSYSRAGTVNRGLRYAPRAITLLRNADVLPTFTIRW